MHKIFVSFPQKRMYFGFWVNYLHSGVNWLIAIEFVIENVNPRGVLRYISDGDVRSPFLGLKFAI